MPLPRPRVLLVALLSLPVLLLAAPAASAIELGPGSKGREVRRIQRELVHLGFLPRVAVTSTYDDRTEHAVIAFQGWYGLERNGYAGAETRRLLAKVKRPVAFKRFKGQRIEVHVSQQVALLVSKKGKVVRAIHVSTGAGGATPTGDFKVIYQSRYSWSYKFKVWLPYASYFYGGYAFHEFGSVPTYAASHGCVRIPASEAETVYGFLHKGLPVHVL